MYTSLFKFVRSLRSRPLLIRAALLLLLPAVAGADSDPGGIDLDAVVRSHPRVQKALLDARSREHRASGAGYRYADPMVEVSRGNGSMKEMDLADPMAQGGRTETTGLKITQPIPFPGKLNTEAKVFDSEARSARIQAAAERNRVAAEYLKLVISASSARRLRTLTEENLRRISVITEIARGRYAAGKGSLSDVMRADIRTALSREKIHTLTGEQESKMLELVYYSAEGTKAAVLPRPESLEKTLSAVLNRALERADRLEDFSLDVLLAKEDEIRRDRMDTAAKLEYLPDFEIFASHDRSRSKIRYGTKQVREEMTVVGLNIRVPLWSALGTYQRTKEEGSALRASRQESANILAKTSSEFRSLREKHRSRSESIRIYAGDLIPRSAQARDAALFAYQTGAIDFAAMLDTVEFLYMQEAERIRLEEEHWMHIVDLGILSNAIFPSNPVLSSVKSEALAGEEKQ